MKLKEELS